MKQCYWNNDPSLTGNLFAVNGQFRPDSGECISNAERFYNILSNLLVKRGKKDFAIRINYSSAPARGQLPTGPWGPAIIGGGSSNQGIPGYGAPQLPSFAVQAPGYGMPYGDPYASSYGLPPPMSGYGMPPAMMPGYGMPQQGYGLPPQMSGYGSPQMSGYGM